LSQKKKLLLIDIVVVIGFVFVAICWSQLAKCLPSCPIKEHFGVYCIGCGGTRFVYHLINFRLSVAFRNNAFLFLLSIYFVVVLVVANVSVLIGKPIYKFICNEKMLWFWIVAGVAFFVLRNIPLDTFAFFR